MIQILNKSNCHSFFLQIYHIFSTYPPPLGSAGEGELDFEAALVGTAGDDGAAVGEDGVVDNGEAEASAT